MKNYWLFLALLPIAAISCTKEDVDTTPPSIQILEYNPAPSPDLICGETEDSVFHLTGGENLAFTVNFQDDKGLSQYKIDIHNNFDCHGHGGASAPGVSAPGVASQTEDWTILDIVGLSGTSQQVTRSLAVPANVTAGAYHFQLQVIDESGNDNPLSNFYSLKILHPADSEPPIITVSNPIGDFSTTKGSTLQFTGEVTDNFSLSEGGNGLVFLTYTDLSSGNTFTTTAYSVFDETVDKTFSFDLSFTVPQTLKAGDYRFTIRAHDGVRNIAEPVSFEVEIN